MHCTDGAFVCSDLCRGKWNTSQFYLYLCLLTLLFSLLCIFTSIISPFPLLTTFLPPFLTSPPPLIHFHPSFLPSLSVPLFLLFHPPSSFPPCPLFLPSHHLAPFVSLPHCLLLYRPSSPCSDVGVFWRRGVWRRRQHHVRGRLGDSLHLQPGFVSQQPSGSPVAVSFRQLLLLLHVLHLRLSVTHSVLLLVLPGSSVQALQSGPPQHRVAVRLRPHLAGARASQRVQRSVVAWMRPGERWEMGKSWFNRFCVFQRNKSRQRFMKYCKTQISVGCSGITTFLKLCFYSFLIVFFKIQFRCNFSSCWWWW